MAFRFAQVTDSHLYGGAADSELPRRDDYYRQCLREVAAHGVDLIVHTGDLVNSCSGYPRHIRFKALLDEMSAELGVPIHVCRGNHEAAKPDLTDAQFAEVWGSLNYTFEHKGWTFLAIDSYVGAYAHCGFFFAMDPDVLDWVEATVPTIPTNAPLIVMMHVCPIGLTNFWRGESVMHALRDHNVRALLFGHVQGNWVSRFRDIRHITVVGERAPFDASPLTYNIATCDDDGMIECDFFPYTVNLPTPPAVPELLVGGKPAPTFDWPDLRGPLGSRAADCQLPDRAPSLAWKAQLAGPLSIGAPTLSDGVLFAGTKTNGRFEQCTVTALDAVSGAVKWTQQTDGSVEGGLFLDGQRGICGTSSGSIHCLDLADGSPVWQWNNRDNIPIASQPIVDDGLVHAGANLQMYAVDVDSGQTVWRTTVSDKSGGYFTGGHSSPLVVEDRVFHQRCCGATEPVLLESLDKRTGQDKIMTLPEYADQGMKRHASPILHSGNIIVVGEGLLVFDRKNPLRPRAHAPWAQSGATPAASGPQVYVSYHTTVVAHDIRDQGRVVWQVPHEPALYHFGGDWNFAASCTGESPASGNYSAPLVCGDKLIVCETSGLCRCFDTTDGTELWRLRVGAPILSAPIVSGNMLCFGDYQGMLYAFAW